MNTDSTEDLLGTNTNDLYGFNETRSRKASLDFISERRRNRNSINSIEDFYNYNSVNNFLFEEKGEKNFLFLIMNRFT